MRWFWLWLCRFSFRRLGGPTRIDEVPDGVPHIRDAKQQCRMYEPRYPHLQDWASCESDGHYLCKECCHLRKADDDPEPERRIP